MSEIKDGGPAFPHEYKFGDGTADRAVGLTVRDYFAAKAIQGICAHRDTWGLVVDEIVSQSYAIADAMLRARGEA
ncbi:hypothetical protein [Burkholderia sp. NRF60-BP8]|uniref:hypothetical protein n=1 Tax=Burkholderia sp. NRF60-BP8 TaxID=1637853 RepID=UPI00075647FF|nr:hypothetical protein [Burkholderia sp. NRF60-BP8]AOI76083.1 hypothetical protein WS54_07230 [Burkholderia sp. NRF60-BP8]KVA07109.1 hypothetical protein WS54_23375 [Burkholderia sp. NRF60-BP8]